MSRSNGQFREDLYYRLNVFAIRLPALRNRRDDILPPSEAFLKEIAAASGVRLVVSRVRRASG